MLRLERSLVAEPACLRNYYATDTWEEVAPADKAQIRAALETLQGRRCAYCEGSLDELGAHIEHFRRKGRPTAPSPARSFPQLTFEWSNLYWSCDQKESCGQYKDHGAGAYEVAELLEPGVDDADAYLRFRSDGTIHVRGKDPTACRRAEETLRVFNLQPRRGRLRAMRKRAAAQYLALADDLALFTPTERAQLLQDELARASGEPFFTTIRHMLEDVP